MANATQNHAHVGWVPEPIVRGTTSLVFSCISTIAICTWTALHLDVPTDPLKSLFRYKLIIWVLVLLAPEVFPMAAFEDWHDAHALTKKMRAYKV